MSRGGCQSPAGCGKRSGGRSASRAQGSAARRGEDSGGGGGGGAVARRSRLLKGTPPAGSLPAAAEHLPLGGAARRGSPSGRERRAGVWTARPEAAAGWGQGGGARPPRGRSHLHPCKGRSAPRGTLAETPSEIQGKARVGPRSPHRPVIQLSV
jgi:hypothetical protein